VDTAGSRGTHLTAGHLATGEPKHSHWPLNLPTLDPSAEIPGFIAVPALEVRYAEDSSSKYFGLFGTYWHNIRLESKYPANNDPPRSQG
jgi:hypothetical protein